MKCPICSIGEIYQYHSSSNTGGKYGENNIAYCNYCNAGIKLKEENPYV